MDLESAQKRWIELDWQRRPRVFTCADLTLGSLWLHPPCRRQAGQSRTLFPLHGLDQEATSGQQVVRQARKPSSPVRVQLGRPFRLEANLAFQ